LKGAGRAEQVRAVAIGRIDERLGQGCLTSNKTLRLHLAL